jgi:serine phosphatase RsbU (regulator of sigma subunit)
MPDPRDSVRARSQPGTAPPVAKPVGKAPLAPTPPTMRPASGAAPQPSSPAAPSTAVIRARTAAPTTRPPSVWAPSVSTPAHRQPSSESRHGRTAPPSHAAARGAAAARQFTRRGLGLRLKFMLILSGLTAAALLGLGLTVSTTVTGYLFGQKQHGGIEVARMAAMVATAVADRMEELEVLVRDGALKGEPGQRTRFEAALNGYFKQAAEWEGLTGASDILSIDLVLEGRHSDRLGAARYGDRQMGSAPIEREFRTVFLPKAGVSAELPRSITIFEAVKTLANGKDVPVYRFAIALPEDRFGAKARIRVDVDRTSVSTARNNVLIAIVVAVILGLAVVIAVANWLAQTVTRPIDVLLRDMRVVSGGNLDHQTRATSHDEVGQLASAFNRMTSDLKVAQHALVEQEKAAYELSMAKEVQRHLLPAETPVMPGYEVAAHYQGAKAVSGDYFDFLPLGEGRWGFIVADVSGKGIPGSMVMAVTRTIVRLMAAKHPDRAAETLKETNRLIARQIKRGMFVTAVYAILDERTGTFSYASAGHNPIVIYRAATRSHELAQGKGIALGFNEGPIFDKTILENRTVLQPGDAFVLYTDGFPEAMNEQSQEFGDERFYKLIAANGHLEPRQLNLGIVGEVARHRGAAEQSDDLTMITVRRRSA